MVPKSQPQTPPPSSHDLTASRPRPVPGSAPAAVVAPSSPRPTSRRRGADWGPWVAGRTGCQPCVTNGSTLCRALSNPLASRRPFWSRVGLACRTGGASSDVFRVDTWENHGVVINRTERSRVSEPFSNQHRVSGSLGATTQCAAQQNETKRLIVWT